MCVWVGGWILKVTFLVDGLTFKKIVEWYMWPWALIENYEPFFQLWWIFTTTFISQLKDAMRDTQCICTLILLK